MVIIAKERGLGESPTERLCTPLGKKGQPRSCPRSMWKARETQMSWRNGPQKSSRLCINDPRADRGHWQREQLTSRGRVFPGQGPLRAAGYV